MSNFLAFDKRQHPLRSLFLAALIAILILAPTTPGHAAALPQAVSYLPELSATPTLGFAPLTVSFLRSVTTDPAGPTIVAAQLNYGDGSGPVDFGDGTSTFAINAISSHTYILPGSYAATFTVFYSDSVVSSTSLLITVDPSNIPGQPPLITASALSGTAPLTVALSSSARSDPTGPLINSYSVAYGDGSSDQFILNMGDGTISFARTSTHVYNAAGSYVAKLTVTYNNATSASSSVTITVNPVVSSVLRSTAITLAGTLKSNKVAAIGSVFVQDANGVIMPGVVVTATWTRPDGSKVTQTVTTNASGIARFSTSGKRGGYTLTVKDLSKTGYTFDSANSVLIASITK